MAEKLGVPMQISMRWKERYQGTSYREVDGGIWRYRLQFFYANHKRRVS